MHQSNLFVDNHLGMFQKHKFLVTLSYDFRLRVSFPIKYQS